MKEMISVKIGDLTKEVPADSCIGEIIRDIPSPDDTPIVVVKVNGVLQELHRQVSDGAVIEPVTMRSPIGFDTYKRSLNFLFLKAVHDIFAEDGCPDTARVILHFSVSNAFYYTIENGPVTDSELIRRILERMQALVDAKLPIKKLTMSTRQARKYMAETNMQDKEKLFRFRRASSVNLYQLEEYMDYFYGYMVWNTDVLRRFGVDLYDKGIVLLFPEKRNPTELRAFRPSEKLFAVQQESEAWAHNLGISTVGDLNEVLSSGDPYRNLLVAEAQQEAKISAIAARIASDPNIKFVMVAGPSSSGKTTFSRRLSIQLKAHGVTPHPISLDNYYRNRSDCPRDADGKPDFECLEALDVPLIKQQMRELLQGKKTELPRFSFLTGQREFHGDIIELGEKDILIIEGIHGLNTTLSEDLPEASIFRVYISALTQLNTDDHSRVSTTDGRLIRRLVRDYRTRGTSAKETIAMWPSVRRGEDSYIFPNQNNADVMFNSSLIYELSILKTYAEPLLFQIQETDDEYVEAKRLLKFLDYFLGMPSEKVPENSILREFIGGSCFDV